MSKVKLTYGGPPHQSNPDVAAATGEPATLEHGKTYSVPAELADQLEASTPHWTRQAAAPKKKRRAKPATAKSTTVTPPPEGTPTPGADSTEVQ